jgi:hypothetical protein
MKTEVLVMPGASSGPVPALAIVAATFSSNSRIAMKLKNAAHITAW